MVRSAMRDLVVLQRIVADLRAKARAQQSTIEGIGATGGDAALGIVELEQMRGAIEALEMRIARARDSVHAGERPLRKFG